MKRFIAPALLASLLVFSSAQAQESSTVAQEWHSYVEPLMPIAERLSPLMADTNDPLLRQELYHMIFMGISSAYVNLSLGDPEQPRFVPIWNPAFNWGAPNPDASYYMSPVSPDGVYKISGFRGTTRLVDFQVASGDFVPYGIGRLEPVRANYDLDKLHIDKKTGAFEVILSAERPAGYQGDWWLLDPRAAYLLVRQVSYDWVNEIDGRFTIDRLDRPAIKPRPGAQDIAKTLHQIAMSAENWPKFVLGWTKNLRDKGLINKVSVHDVNSIGGLSTQVYIDGAFELNPDEALIYETEVPKRCRYWNIELTDTQWRAIDWGNRQSSLNGHSAQLDKDGRFRAVIAATDPGVPNWLDTAGYAKGALFGRWTECSSAPTPTVTLVKLAEIRKYLPASTPVVTPEQRDAAIRLIRKGSQLRKRW